MNARVAKKVARWPYWLFGGRALGCKRRVDSVYQAANRKLCRIAYRIRVRQLHGETPGHRWGRWDPYVGRAPGTPPF